MNLDGILGGAYRRSFCYNLKYEVGFWEDWGGGECAEARSCHRDVYSVLGGRRNQYMMAFDIGDIGKEGPY